MLLVESLLCVGSKQAYRVVHQPVSLGLAVFADEWCLAVGLACGDQRRLTGNGSALEVVLHDDALYKSTYFTLLYFVWNSFPDVVNFTSLLAFKRSIRMVDFREFLTCNNE